MNTKFPLGRQNGIGMHAVSSAQNSKKFANHRIQSKTNSRPSSQMSANTNVKDSKLHKKANALQKQQHAKQHKEFINKYCSKQKFADAGITDNNLQNQIISPLFYYL